MARDAAFELARLYRRFVAVIIMFGRLFGIDINIDMGICWPDSGLLAGPGLVLARLGCIITIIMLLLLLLPLGGLGLSGLRPLANGGGGCIIIIIIGGRLIMGMDCAICIFPDDGIIIWFMSAVGNSSLSGFRKSGNSPGSERLALMPRQPDANGFDLVG